MQTRTVAYESGETKIVLEVREATALTGMKRALLRGRADAYLQALSGESDEESSAENNSALDVMAATLMARVVYPDLVACVVSAEGLDVATLDIAGFCDLPDSLVDAWEAAVYDLNPHWLPRSDEEETEGEKKEPQTSA